MTNETAIITLESTPLMQREDILPDSIINQYAELPEDLKYSSEEEIRQKHRILPMDEQIRSAFWREMQVCLRVKKRLNLKHVYTGLCSEVHFHRIVRQPHRLAWITTPVVAYEARTDSLLTLAIGRYEEILNMDIKQKKRVITGADEDGKAIYGIEEVIDPFRAKLLMETIKNLEERVKGLSVQRQHHIHEKNKAENTDVSALGMDEVNKKLAEVQAKLGIHKEEGDIIDVTPTNNSDS